MKREPVGNEREQDTWLGNTLRQSPATAPDACLDAETLAAWADGGLSTKAAAAVELHASNCSHCMAVLAAMERTAPAPTVTHAWTPMRLFRWVAPLAAAVTAVAIWVAVPERPIAPVESMSERADQGAGTVPVPENPAPGTGNQEPQEKPQLRDELRRERAEPQALGSVAAPVAPSAPEAPAPEAPPPAAGAVARADAPPPPAPAPAPQTFATDTVAESATAATAQRSMTSMNLTAKSAESISPPNPLMRWRVVQPVSVERSRDGGKTWTKTTLPAPNIVSVRAVDGDRAVATTSDNAQFYTANGGQSWTRVQENSAAPF